MLPLEELTVGGLLRRTCSRFGSRPAIWQNGTVWSWTELERQTEEYAAAFASQGIRKGDHVGLWAEAEPNVLAAYYALQLIGAVPVMLNTSLFGQELQTQLDVADVRVLCVGRSYKKGISLAQKSGDERIRGNVERVFSVTDRDRENLLSLDEICREMKPCWRETARQMEQAVTPQDTATILFTSGSTSVPKAVMTSHYARVNNGIQQASDLNADANDVFCLAMPIFHCFSIAVNLTACLATGACLCLPQDRHTGSILTSIEQAGCTVLSSVPTMYLALIANKSFSLERVTSLRTGIIGGAGYPPEQFIAIEKALGMTLLSSLGQTECSAGLTICSRSDSLERRSRTVGHFMDHVEGKIADPATGAALPVGECGEICVRGYLVMQGYYGQPALTAQTLDAEGWLHTGDLGILDPNGDITLRGRIKELIIRGGENISPAEIELELLSVPEITQCKVVGVPDPHYGEEICACCCLRLGASLTEEQLRSRLARTLAYYKIPRYLLFWQTLPQTATGKIDRCAVKQNACAQLFGS